jgi:hypothetical protein
MSIVLKTDCSKCVHKAVCKYKDAAKLAKETYEKSLHVCGDMAISPVNVDVTFSCPQYWETSSGIRYVKEDEDDRFAD